MSRNPERQGVLEGGATAVQVSRRRSGWRGAARSPAWAILVFSLVGASIFSGQPSPQATPPATFFATSVGNGAAGGNYGGLAGADQRCEQLAAAAGLLEGGWRAYLSTSVVDARDRIGPGPWHNVLGALMAIDLDDLHGNGLAAADVVDENGDLVPAGAHDILTGSNAQGRLGDPFATCADFQVNDRTTYTWVGHSDGDGVGDGFQISWNSAHLTQCSEQGLAATAGEGRLYCFLAAAALEVPIFEDGFESGDVSSWSAGSTPSSALHQGTMGVRSLPPTRAGASLQAAR